MKEKIGFNEIEIGLPLGPWEIDVTPETVDDYMDKSLWHEEDFPERERYSPSGIFITDHVRMLTKALGGAGSRIWAKSRHEFINPIRVGSRLTKKGRVVEKYVK
ncbi:MAG: hypothetical protein ABII06_16195, partial [Pseudomonadota bacterium]